MSRSRPGAMFVVVNDLLSARLINLPGTPASSDRGTSLKAIYPLLPYSLSSNSFYLYYYVIHMNKAHSI